MAKKKPVSKKKPSRNKAKSRKASSRKGAPQTTPNKLGAHVWAMLGLIIITLFAYLPALDAGFVNWDDNLYVTENGLLSSFSWGKISELFTNFTAGNYHPMTMLTLAVNYQMGGLDPSSYHWTSLLFHLLNVGLVFWFIYRLTNENLVIATVTTFFFAIHPMHVESVAWISSRKDVLYTCFFFLGLIQYLNFIEKQSWKPLIGAGIFFVLACLSKPAAVVFPLCLMLVDYLKGRNWRGKKEILEKIPFFLISIGFGLLAIYVQGAAGAIDDGDFFSFLDRILFAFYSLMIYFVKAFIPFDLSCYYPYPEPSEGLSIGYYIAPVFVLAVAFLGWVSRKQGKTVIFGLLFFLVNLLLVLQLLSVGGAILAERYTYVPYIGLFFIVASGFSWVLDQKSGRWSKYRTPAAGALGLMAIAFVLLNHQQAKVWNNGETLWTQAINSFPDHGRNYLNRAEFLDKAERMPEALADMNKAIQLKGNDPSYLLIRGRMLFDVRKDQEAMKDFQTALTSDPDDEEKAQIYVNMGSVYGRAQNLSESLKAYNQALAIDPDNKKGLVNRGMVHSLQGNLDASLQDYGRYLNLYPEDNDMRALNGMATVYFNKGKYAEALPYFTKAIQTGKADAQTYMSRSQCYFLLGDKSKALQNATTARQRGLQVPEAYFNQLKSQ